jgi:hypothetical protein
MNKKIKSPSQLFEEKRLKSLEEFECQKIVEENIKLQKILNKKIKSPKELFGEIVEYDFTQVLGQNNTTEEVDNTVDPIEILEERINSLPKPKYYDNQILTLKDEIINVKKIISQKKEFDPSDLIEKISFLRDTIEILKEEIPQQISYDDQLENIEKSINNLRQLIPEVPEVKYYDQELIEILNLIETVKNEIPVLPEIKYYDEQILSIENWIRSLPEPRYYDEDLENIENSIEDIETKIRLIPEIKYYDEDVIKLQESILIIKNEINSIPKVKYYDEELKILRDDIHKIESKIPSVPEVRYYDEEIGKLNESIEKIKLEIPEIPEVKYYDDDIENLKEKIDQIKSDVVTIIEKPEVQIPEVKYYDDQIDKIYSDLNQINSKIISIKLDESKTLKNFENIELENKKLLEKISYIEEVFSEFTEKTLLDGNKILTESPTTNTDPLVPLNQEFVTFKQLKEHYTLFINRIQQQLSTIGGGGETQFKYLDDIVGIATNAGAYDGKYLKYNHAIRKFEFTTVVGEDADFEGTLQNLFDVDATNLDNESIMIYDLPRNKFVFVDPKTYFGINADYNPDSFVDDYGAY